MKTRTFKLNKLVRDNIVQSTEAQGGSAEYTVLEGQELINERVAKVGEESEELRVSDEPSLEELADLREAVEALAVSLGYSLTELHAAQYDKRRKMGGFTTGHFVETVTVPADSELAEYYAADPTRFPEITSR